MPRSKRLCLGCLILLVQTAGAGSNLVIYGSSVAKGLTAKDEAGNVTSNSGSWALSYAGRLTAWLEEQGYSVTNNSTPGDSTSLALADFDSKVVPVNPDVVLIGLSLANEGLANSVRPESTQAVFLEGMQELIARCRTNGFYPVIGLTYANNNYSPRLYQRVKEMNLILNQLDVPSLNFLGALENGSGQWASGFSVDPFHPNADGHRELFYAIPPSLFHALEAGKTNGPSLAGTTGFLRLTTDPAQPAPLAFIPSNRMHSFNAAFSFRTVNTGTVAAIQVDPATCRIDFGGVGGDEVGPLDRFGNTWNSATNASAGAVLSNLVTTAGSDTMISISNRSTFGRNGGSAGGLLAPDTSLLGNVAVSEATEDYWFTSSGTGISFDVLGLDGASAYTLRLFGSRSNTSTRVTRYTVTGSTTQTVTLTTSGTGTGSNGYNGNNDTVVQINSMLPDASDRMNVRLQVESGGFAYINLLELVEVSTGTHATVEARAAEVAYVAPGGQEITTPVDADGGGWVDVALSHRYADQTTLFFVDGVLAGTLAEQMAPARFVLGGADGAPGRPQAPASLDLQDWLVHRAAWQADEALAQHQGDLQQASLEICAPLNDSSFTEGTAVSNRAQTLSEALVNATNPVAGLAVAPPSGLHALSYSSDEIALLWTDNSTSETAYVVERRVGGAGTGWGNLAVLAAGSTAYTDTIVSVNTAYDYRVSSQEGPVQSDYSGIITATAGQDRLSFQGWRWQYFNPDSTRYRVDLNNSGSTNYTGEVWNTVTSRFNAVEYTLVNTYNDSAAAYVLSVTDPFDTERSGNGSPLPEFPGDPQSTLFVSTESNGMGQITLSGLHPDFSYDLTLFGRRGTVVGGFDYTARYGIEAAGDDVSFEVNTATNDTASRIIGLQPENGEIVLNVSSADFPDGTVFPGISLLGLDAYHPDDTFLLDFNTNQNVNYAMNQSWNTITSESASVTYSLVNASGSSGDGISLTVTEGFDGFRDGNNSALGGVPFQAEKTLFHGPAQMTISGLNTNLTYDFTFLARRRPNVSGFDYSAAYIFKGAGNPVTNITDAGTNLAYSTVKGMTPDGSGEISLEVANGPGAGTDFPVINLLRIVEVSTGSVADAESGPSEDPDGDGVANFVEYAYGLSPLVTNANPVRLLDTGTKLGSNNFHAFYQRTKAASEIQYVIESTTNLVSPDWQEDLKVSESVFSDDGTNQLYQVERAVTEPRVFFRLGVKDQ